MLLQSDRLEAAVASSELRYAIKIAVRQGRDKMQAEPPPPPPFLPLSLLSRVPTRVLARCNAPCSAVKSLHDLSSSRGEKSPSFTGKFRFQIR